MALGYRENRDSLSSKKLVVYGVNDKDAVSARQWIEDEDLPFVVLLDPDWALGIAYGISDENGDRYVSNNSEGRRPAVVIDEYGNIAAYELDMNRVDQIETLISNL